MDGLNGTVSNSFKLVNPRNNRVIAIVDNRIVTIIDKLIKRNYTIQGLIIPPRFRESFQGKKDIELGDELFNEAFMKVGVRKLMKSGYIMKPLGSKKGDVNL